MEEVTAVTDLSWRGRDDLKVLSMARVREERDHNRGRPRMRS